MTYKDSKAPFNLFQDHGYYTVGEEKFLYKYNAILNASKNNERVKWYFNDEVYSTINWTKKSGRSLLENYKIRAQQIRDKYDYLILSFSGGADSTTILEAFLSNNIKIDEIYCDWPIKLTEMSGAKVSYETHYDNHFSEYFLTTVPKLKEISSQYPDIKIHISDSLSNPNILDFEEYSFFMNIPVHIQCTLYHRYIYEYMHKLSQETNKKIGLIKGVDKPFVHLNKNNDLGMLFIDNGVVNKSDVHERMSHNVELFYWSPEFPQLVVDQVHSVIEFLEEHPTVLKKIETTLRTMKGINDRKTLYNNIITSIVYPNWKFPFQVDKQPFGRPNCFIPILKPFMNEEFIKYHFRRQSYDYVNLSKLNEKNFDHPTPLETFTKWYPVTNINNIFSKLQDFKC